MCEVGGSDPQQGVANSSYSRQTLLRRERKEDEMGVACGTYGEERNAYRVLVGKP